MSNVPQRSFTGGEVSPVSYARTDLAKYATSVRTLRNFLVSPLGGASNRPGTELVGLPGGRAWLLPFVFNAGQAYALEFTGHRLRFIRGGAYVGAPYSITTPYATADLAAIQYSQSADVVTLVHPSYPPMELKRLADAQWTLTVIAFGPTIATPETLTISPASGTISGGARRWVVTALSASGEESLPSNEVGITLAELRPPANTLGWNAVPKAIGYNVYVAYVSGGFGLVGTTDVPSFQDAGLTPDFFNQPPVARPLFVSAGDYPAAVGMHQQRTVFAGSRNNPERFWTSRTADLHNFNISFPTQDDDAVTATLASSTVNAIRHVVSGKGLALLTSGSEFLINGDQQSILRPTDVNAAPISEHGSSALRPLKIGGRVLFVQDAQSLVRELVEDTQGDDSGDLTLFAGHLFPATSSLVAWAYQKRPSSVVWCVRSDGTLLSLTTLASQQVLAWARHDTDGLVESVCVIPEGNEDRLYLVVNRNGVRCVERMASRAFADVQDAVFVDSALSYDGRNTSAATMTLSGGTTWEFDELLTITGSAGAFTPTEIGNETVFTGALDGLPIRVSLEQYVNASTMRGHAARLVPADLRNVATSAWSRAVDVVTGLRHLEGKALAVTADGAVVASPNNAANPVRCVVTDGAITLDRPYSYLRAGLPYLCDLETLDIDTASGPSIKDGKILVNGLTLVVHDSMGPFAGQAFPTGGDPLEGMDEVKMRDEADDYGPIALVSGQFDMTMAARWTKTGRVAIRHVEPVPLTILAVLPRGSISSGG